MSAVSHERGHLIEYRDGDWYYAGTGDLADGSRPCVACGLLPTPEGHDACLGALPDTTAACCGHGVHAAYRMTREPTPSPARLSTEGTGL